MEVINRFPTDGIPGVVENFFLGKIDTCVYISLGTLPSIRTLSCGVQEATA